MARVPEDVSLKVQEYELGIIMPWAPQDLILSHPVSRLDKYNQRSSTHCILKATGVFVTHGGQNSTLEALLHGIPMFVSYTFFIVVSLTKFPKGSSGHLTVINQQMRSTRPTI